MGKAKAHIKYRSTKEFQKDGNGKILPGVTTIINVLAKPALIVWANKIGLEGIEVGRYVDDKAAIGVLAHQMVVDYLRGDKTNTDDYTANQIEQAEYACLSFFNWRDKHKVELLWAEKPLVSEKWGFGGTPDIYAKIDGIIENIDLKTGSGIYPEHLTQVAGGYEILMAENGYMVEQIRILNIPRTKNENWGEVIVSGEQQILHSDLFLACLKIYNLRKQIKTGVTYAKKHEVK